MADVTEVIHKITYEINDSALIQQYEKILRLTKTLDGLSAVNDKATVSAAGMGNAFGKAFGKAGWVGLAVDAGKVLNDFAQQSVKVALAAEDIKIAFNNLNRPELLNDMRKATRGMVSDVELMKSAIEANNLSLPLEHMAVAMHFAEMRARQTGESVELLTRQLITGLGAGSAPILSNLQVDIEKINDEFVNTGDYAGAATKVIYEHLQQSGADMVTYGDKINLLKTFWDNFKLAAGEALLDTGNSLAKSIAMTNPSTMHLAILAEIEDNERESYRKRQSMLHHYIGEYEKGDSQTRSTLINQAANYHLRLERLEDNARKKGLTRQANHYAGLLRLIDQFYAQTIDKAAQQPGNTLRGLYAQKRVLEEQLEGLQIGGAKFRKTKNELDSVQSSINRATGGVGDKTSGDIYTEKKTRIDTEAKIIRNTDKQLRELSEKRIELEGKYKALYAADIAAGTKLSAEERTAREMEYEEQQRRINNLEARRLNDLEQTALQKKLQLARVKKNEKDAAELERQIQDNKLKDAQLARESVQLRADRIEHIEPLKSRSEFRKEYKPRTTELPGNKEKQEGLTREQKDNIKKGIEGYQQLAQAAADAYNQILQVQIDTLDKEISLREKRVEEAKKLAERGNTEALRLEEERLRKAQQQRENFARRQQAVNAAITVSNAIAAVARAALDGGGFGSVATIAALIAALAAGYAAVTSLSNDSGNAFADGVIDYKGKGGPRDDKNWVRISTGESIITAEGTKKHRALLEAINNGTGLQIPGTALPFVMPAFKSPEVGIKGQYASANDMQRLETKLDEVVGAIEDNKLKQDIFFNEQGVGIMTEKAIQKNRSRWK